jgi:surface protein
MPAQMFQSCILLNGDISAWNTASVSSFTSFLQSAVAFNVDVGRWNTASVACLGQMFAGAAAFNGDVSMWNVATATNMNNVRATVWVSLCDAFLAACHAVYVCAGVHACVRALGWVGG